MNIIPIVLGAKPGIQRDGTSFHSDNFIAGQYCRFYHGWPQKMLGWADILQGTEEVVGSIFGNPNSQSYDVYLGRPSSLNYFNITNNGAVTGEITRTPVVGFTPNGENLWSFTATTLTSGGAVPVVIAQVSPNLNDITTETDGPVFYGSKNSNAPFVQFEALTGDGPVGPITCSGGVIATSNNLIVVYGNEGIRFCLTSDVTNWSAWETFGRTKCCAAINYQGSLLLWTLDGLYRAQYVPGDAALGIFNISEISPNISIWSSKSIVVYQNIVYWVGKGQFYVYNGSVGRLDNIMNNNWFFDTTTGVNRNYKAKIAGFVDELNDEICFLFPKGVSASENNYMIMYYPQSRAWADSPMERSVALSLSTYDYRIMPSTKIYKTILTSNTIISTYPIFQHEYGYDDVFNNYAKPIDAFVIYPYKDFFSSQPSAENNICMQTFRVEPDFVLQGTMELNIINKMYAQSSDIFSDTYTFDQSTEYIDIAPTQGRLVSVQIRSNVVGGYFEGGKTLHGIQRGAAAA